MSESDLKTLTTTTYSCVKCRFRHLQHLPTAVWSAGSGKRYFCCWSKEKVFQIFDRSLLSTVQNDISQWTFTCRWNWWNSAQVNISKEGRNQHPSHSCGLFKKLLCVGQEMCGAFSLDDDMNCVMDSVMCESNLVGGVGQVFVVGLCDGTNTDWNTVGWCRKLRRKTDRKTHRQNILSKTKL